MLKLLCIPSRRLQVESNAAIASIRASTRPFSGCTTVVSPLSVDAALWADADTADPSSTHCRFMRRFNVSALTVVCSISASFPISESCRLRSDPKWIIPPPTIMKIVSRGISTSRLSSVMVPSTRVLPIFPI